VTGPWDGLLHPPQRRPMDGLDRDHKPVGRVHLIEDDAMVPLTGAAAGGATLRRKALGAAPRPAGTTKQMAKADRKAAACGERFLPLQPGQKRRIRVGADGQPVQRGQNGYVRAEAPAPAPTPAPPPPMTYQQAIALRTRALVHDQPVDREQLAEADRIVQERRAQVRAELEKES